VQRECFLKCLVSFCPLIASSDVQGECKKLPSKEFLKKAGGPLLEDLLPGQCVILNLINAAIFTYNSYVVDNIYIRHPVGRSYGGLALTHGSGAVFLINSTFDAATSDDLNQRMLYHSGPVYAEGVFFLTSCLMLPPATVSILHLTCF
jgi:hypothetical protein